MENAAKALQMAAGVLLALMIAALVVWGFRQMSKMPEQEDELLSTEQLQKFNQEFEVYDKSLMYGVDVISCLNKVQNYNNKYVLTNDSNAGKQLKGTGFFSGTSEAGKDFKINIYLSLTKPLEETLEFYKIDPESGKEIQIRSLSGDGTVYEDIKLKDVFGETCFDKISDYTSYKKDMSIGGRNGNGAFEKKSNELNDEKKYIVGRDPTVYTNIGKHTCPDPINDKYKDGYYSLMCDDENCTDYVAPRNSSDTDTKIAKLLKLSDKLTITQKNTGNWKYRDTKTNKDEKISYDILSKVIWKNAVYDLKQKQFTCQRIEYSAKTGQVNAIYFAEK